MKNKMKLLFSSLALLAFGATSCSQVSNNGINYSYNNKLVTSVSLSSSYEEHEIGDVFQILASVSFVDDKEVEVHREWKSSKINVARVRAEGNLATVEVVGSGTTYITYRAGYEMAYCKIYVPGQEVDPTPEPVDPSGQKVNLSVTSRTLGVGESFNLTANPSPAGTVTFTSSDSGVITVDSSDSNACIVTAVGEGTANVVATVNDTTAYCEVSVVGEEDPGEKEYTIYFFIDYNNVDPKDNTQLLSKFKWYYDRPLVNAVDEHGNPAIPTVTDSMAKDEAFPYFIGWSTHPIIDSKKDLWDLNKDTVADLPMESYSVMLYGQWFDVPVLPA